MIQSFIFMSKQLFLIAARGCMAGHLIYIKPSVPNHFKQPCHFGKISSADNTGVICTWHHSISVILVLISAFIYSSVYLHSDLSIHDKGQLEYSRSGVAKYCESQRHFCIKQISTSYTPVKHADRCCFAFTQRLEKFNVRDTYNVPTAYQFYSTYRLVWCNAPPTANLQSPHQAL